MQQRFSLQNYTVGWVCALPVELAAAAELLDEEHQAHPININDNNIYTLGCMSGHNVVIACLPAGQLGTSSAATVASHMKSTFTSIRFGLMVGIGGGVPSSVSDIRLGDVVVSKPYLEHPGVIQYDFGKTEPSGFKRTGTLNAPPSFLLSAVTTLQANHYRNRSSLLPYISAISSQRRFARSSAGADILFEATYHHVGGATCDQCDKSHMIQRKERESTEVFVHYGTIASGNQVIKNGTTRDELSSKLDGVLCFEMEAAGLMNSFPCLVIRGICDYADSHKNESWQPYAAAVAAAYGKTLLSIIPAAEVAKQDPLHNDKDPGADFVHVEEPGLEAGLANLAQEKNLNLDWRTSIFDLLKLLGLASNFETCEGLAERLHVHIGPTGSAKQNTALHKAVMRELSKSYGRVPLEELCTLLLTADEVEETITEKKRLRNSAGEGKWEKVMESRKKNGRCLNCGSESWKHRGQKCPSNCGKCLYPNHEAPECKFSVRCMECQRSGHMAGDCPVRIRVQGYW